MPRSREQDSTSVSLLRKAVDWDDHPTWTQLQERYDPLIRRCCRRYRLVDEDADEVRQDVWIEVAKRLRSFVYDPRRSFRGWLWTVCRHKCCDFLEKRKRERALPLDDRDEPWAEEDGGGEAQAAYVALLREAEEIQDAVRRRVEARTWEAFWLVAVRFQSAGEVAEQLGMTIAAVYKASQRVQKMLRAEGRRPDGEPFGGRRP